MSTSVSSVASHFPSPQDGFTTTTSGSVSSGATSVGMSSVGSYANGSIFVGVIDPTDTNKKQTFTGVVDTSGVQITSVVWTAGTNQTHSAGATVVDYATATHIAMISKGIRVQHGQDGTHGAVTATSVSASGNITSTGGALSADTISEYTSAAGVTIDGVKMKDSLLATNASVPPSALATGAANTDVTASQTTTSTSYTALATAQTVTVTVGANGLLLVGVGAGKTSNNTASAETYMSFALSGANTLASADNVAANFQSSSANIEGSVSRVVLLTGLSAGSTVVTAQFKVATGGSGSGTGTWVNRNLWAVPL